MILVTTDYIEGKTLEMLGIVGGATIQSKHIGKDIGAGFKTLVGGELRGYTEMMEEARSIAEKRMVENAEKMGADAVVNVRYTTSAIMQGASEVMVYGTAVTFRIQNRFVKRRDKDSAVFLYAAWKCILS